MTNKAPSMMMPAIVVGGVAGLLSGLPPLHLGCCIWAAGAGFLASLWYSRNCQAAGSEFSAGKGAVLGILTGAVSGLLGGLIFSSMFVMAGAANPEVLRESMETVGPMMGDQQSMDQAVQFIESAGPMFFVLLFVLIWIVIGVLLATLGGLIGGSAFKIETASADSGNSMDSNPPPAPPVADNPPPPPVDPSA